MSARERPTEELQVRKWVPFAGDFGILKEFYAQKERPFWRVLQLFDALLRGFGQAVFANNPLSGLVIIVTLAVVAPGTLALSAATGALGLLLSVLVRESQDNVENGLTVYNPLLVGAVSYMLIPQIYGAFDAFSFLLVFLGTIFSVYLARSLGGDKFPCITWPFNLVELTLICVLSTVHENGADTVTKPVEPMFEMYNATSETTTMTNDAAFYLIRTHNATNDIDWGMVFRGIVVSSSQLLGVDNVVVASIMYLALLIYSPTTTVFSFFGALVGSLTGLELGARHDEIYSGYWGYNSFLTGAALGGNLFVLNFQTTMATLAAIVCTALAQYCILLMFSKAALPILTLPFVVVASLFLTLRNGKENVTFPRPISISFPEKQRQDYLASRSAFVRGIETSEEASTYVVQNENRTTPTDN